MKKKTKKSIRNYIIVYSLCIAIVAVSLAIINRPANYQERKRYVDEVSNDRTYEWYIDQLRTGKYAKVNCVPSTLVMAAKWQNEEFPITPQKVRNDFGSQGGGFNLSQHEMFLDEYNINYSRKYYTDSTDLTKELDAGHIIIVAADVEHISPRNVKDSYVGRYYWARKNQSHSFILKGYLYFESEMYYEVYDPYNSGEYHKNGEHKGKDRLYLVSDVDNAINNNWKVYYVIYNNNLTDD